MTSPSDLSGQLGDALAAHYRIERELGGGGMSRVFVGEELALQRRIVLKLLPPELAAAVSVERFRREIQNVARLQHPHIVPVLSAGSADGLLYYTMPFVEGRSLRDRIEREGALPIGDAIDLMIDIAGALAYAHAEGLIHRDIKPENVLLSQGHGLLTDFGIAKALTSDGTAAGVANATGGLTGLGMSIGTPAYMAPEQGVGDPSTDHRADLYSFGVLAYELLAGRTPFAHRSSAHQLLVAHMTEPPTPIREVRADVSPGLADVVMRCLAKQPDDRFARADDVVRALRGLRGATGDSAIPVAVGAIAGARGATSGGSSERAAGIAPSTRPPRRRGLVYGVVGLVLGIATVVAIVAVRRGTVVGTSESSDDRITVATFANETGDPSLAPVGRMTANWLTTALAGTGIVKVLDARTAGGNEQGTDAAAALRTAKAVGATTVLTGSYYRVGDSLRFDATLLDASTGQILLPIAPVTGPASDPTIAIDLVRQRALGALATRLDPQLAYVARSMSRPPSYDAYQRLVAGIDAFTASDMRTAFTRFQEAAALDTTSVQARLWMLEALESMGQAAAADTVVRQLEARRDRLSPLEQAQLEEYASSIRKDLRANVAATFRIHARAPNGEYRTTLARKLMAANRVQEAFDTLTAADPEVGLFKNKSFSLDVRRQLLHRLGRHEDELRAVDELTRRFAGPQRLVERARVFAALGRADSIAPLVAGIVAADPSVSARALMRAFADELQAHDHRAEARSLLEQTLADYARIPADSQQSAPVARGRAETLMRLGRWPEAEAALAPVASDTMLAGRLQMAIVSARAGHPERATALERELAALPVNTYRPGDRLYLRARLAAARHDRAVAVSLLREAQQRAFPVYEFVHGNFEFDELRGEPSFEAVLKPIP